MYLLEEISNFSEYRVSAFLMISDLYPRVTEQQ